MFSYSSIVLAGNFNPAIFHPEWFERFKILPIQETQWAEGERGKISEVPYEDKKIIIAEVPPILVRPDKAEINFLSIKLSVRPNRFECATFQRDKFRMLKDVTVKIFDLLRHTPINGVGINFEGHLKFKNESDQILKDLFSKKDEEYIKYFGEKYNIGGILYSSSESLKKTLKIDKSERLEGGISYNINYHRDVESMIAEQALEIIEHNYDADIENVASIITNLIGTPTEIWTL